MRMPMAKDRRFIKAQCKVNWANLGTSAVSPAVSGCPVFRSASTCLVPWPVPVKSKRSAGGNSNKRKAKPAWYATQ